MRTVTFGRTGVRLPAVGLGTWAHGGPNVAGGRPVGWSGGDERAAREALIRGHRAGLVHWDTADVYGEGRSEEMIGSVWNEVPRDAIFLATKVGFAPGPEGNPYDPEHVRGRLERSLRNLRTDRIDLYYFHHCDFGPTGERLEPALELFHRLRDEGKVRFIGVSDWDSRLALHYARLIQPDAVQVDRSVLEDDWDASGLAAWAAEQGAAAVFFSPLKHGLLLGKYDRPPELGPGDVRSRVPEFREQALLAHLRACRGAVEERFAAHPNPVLHALVGALLADAPDACVLLGLRNPAQVEAAATVGDPLSVEDADWVRRLYQARPS